MWLRKFLLFWIFIVQTEALDAFKDKKSSVKNLQISEKSTKNNKQCNLHLQTFHQALKNREKWAAKLVDTWAKVDAGYLKGNLINFGDFDSCVQFQHQNFQGQHCLITLSTLTNSTLNDENYDLNLRHLANFLRDHKLYITNGFCMPNTCSDEAVVEFLNENFLFQNDLVALGGACRDIHDIHFGALEYFAVSIAGFDGFARVPPNILIENGSIFITIASLMIASTAYEIMINNSTKSKPNKLLASFSVHTNGSKLFDMTKIKSPSSINCLHGLRGMSILWITLGHRFTFQYPYGNPLDVIDFLNNNPALGLVNKAHPLAVDTFFVMGAVLMTWSTLRDCEKQQLNIFRMIWRRYIRYTPVYAALILLVVAFSKIILQGPLYFEEYRETCVKSWWYALLHIQNYIPPDQMCLEQGWYLSIDFQLFVISPFIIWLIHKYGKKLLALPVVLCVVTIANIITASIIYDIEVPALKPSNEYLKYFYYPTHTRAGPWFIGMILGYFMYVHRGQKIRINKLLNGFLWIISISTLALVIFLQFAISISEDPLPRTTHVSYLAFNRNLWALAVCWIIFACQNLKTGGIVRWFLSLPQWQPMSRMGLSMYLTGPVYQVFMILNQRVPMYMNFWSWFPIVISDFVIIAMISVAFYLAFEAPPLIIEEYIYKKLKCSSVSNK